MYVTAEYFSECFQEKNWNTFRITESEQPFFKQTVFINNIYKVFFFNSHILLLEKIFHKINKNGNKIKITKLNFYLRISKSASYKMAMALNFASY